MGICFGANLFPSIKEPNSVGSIWCRGAGMSSQKDKWVHTHNQHAKVQIMHPEMSMMRKTTSFKEGQERLPVGGGIYYEPRGTWLEMEEGGRDQVLKSDKEHWPSLG